LLDSTLFRLASPGAWITLLVLLTLVWGSILRLRNGLKSNQTEADQVVHQESNEQDSNSLPFVLLLVAAGTGLVLFPEFFYLRDQFGWRMNTIFKFYYQAWILWAIAASVFSYILWNGLQRPIKWISRVVLVISLLAGLMYPFYCFNDRFTGLKTDSLNLDGNAYFTAYYPDETAAINFLIQAPDGTVAEAIGGSYSGYARVSTQSGQATVLGWPGHESQWRGGAKEIGNRESDIKLLYQTNDWPEALGIIQKYHIRYIFLASLERDLYRVNENKFAANLLPAFQNKSVVIYEVPTQLLHPSPSN
jgi:uncharacterized membrane protein